MKYVVIALAVVGFWILVVAAWKRFMNIVDPTPTDAELKRIRENDEKFMDSITKKPQ